MWYSLDRVEGAVAVLVSDAGDSVEVPMSSLPPQIKVGTRLRRTDGGFVSDEDETARRRRYVLALQERLRQKNTPSG